MSTTTLQQAADKIVAITADYRSDEGAYAPKSARVLTWLDQFELATKDKQKFLAAYSGVLEKSYFSRANVEQFLKKLAENPKLTQSDPKAFWQKTRLLNIQQGGRSQAEMIAILNPILETQVKTASTGSDNAQSVIYLDDVLFSGNRIVHDIGAWLPNSPKEVRLILIVIARHTGGWFYVEKRLNELAKEAGKKVSIELWSLKTFNNMSNDGSMADVFRLAACPIDDETKQYLALVSPKDPAALLRGSGKNSSNYFEDEESRRLLEDSFWKTGLVVRERCPNFKETHRPLGYTSTGSKNKLGFGSTIVTYRNCPNNAPLALWAGAPWLPLFPRKNN